MNNKIIVVLIAVLVIIFGGYLLLKTPSSLPNLDSASNTAPAKTKTLSNSNNSASNVVNYTDSGYEPATIKIKVGDTVTFQNKSSQSNWTASAFHPTHTAYPTTGGCLGSTFDACKGILPGDSWSFKFDFAGNWKYHNHLNPEHFGTVVVE